MVRWPAAGVHSFCNATMFRTDARSESGDVCGLHNVHGKLIQDHKCANVGLRQEIGQSVIHFC